MPILFRNMTFLYAWAMVIFIGDAILVLLLKVSFWGGCSSLSQEPRKKQVEPLIVERLSLLYRLSLLVELPCSVQLLPYRVAHNRKILALSPYLLQRMPEKDKIFERYRSFRVSGRRAGRVE